MKKKLIFLFVGILIMRCSGSAFAWTEWNYTGVSHLWSYAANWGGAVPTASGDPIMRGQGVGKEALIDSSVTAVGHMMYVGYSGRADLNITGGSLTLSNQFRLGQTGGTGNVTVSGGAVSVGSDMVVGDGGTGVGTLNMTNGTINHLTGWLYVGYNGATGTINLDGGTLSTYKVMMGSGHPHVNITKGKLIIRNTDSAGVATEMNGYITALQLTFYNGDPRATHAFTVNGSGYTEITASLPNAEYAWNPNPINISTGVGLSSNLSWSAGIGAVSHDVYFGTNFSDVNTASRLPFDFNGDGIVDWADLAAFSQQWLTSAADFDFDDSGIVNFVDFASFAAQYYTEAVPQFRGNQDANTFSPGTLSPNTTYYWRVDEVLPLGTFKGSIWQFSTGPIIVVPATDTLAKYDVLYTNIGTTVAYSNPYDPCSIRVDAIITPPTGSDMVVPCFYTGGASGNSQWQCRFTPRQVGTYSYHIDIYQASVLSVSSDTFTLAVSDSTKDGFVGKNASSYYTFILDSGKRFRGIGENIGWEQGGYMYDRLFPLLNTLGCNYVRVWMSNPYNQPLEGITRGIGLYDETIAARMDNTVALAQTSGIYLTVSFNGCGELDPAPTDPTTGWPKNPYNTVNGGMCPTMTDFFTSAAAKAQYKKKLRYIVARWGYSPNVAAFEFWNEIDGEWVNYGGNRDAVKAWHNEMAPYLKSIDPFDHIVTTSCTGYQISNFWNMPDIDFSQSHPYKIQLSGDTLDPVSFNSIISTTYESVFGKPHVLGEFGYTSGEPTIETHANMVDNLHRGLWAGMFSPTPILPQTWWWDYFEQNNDESQFSVAATFLIEIMRDNAELSMLSVSSSPSTDVERMAVIAGHDRFVWLRNKSGSTMSSVSFTLSLVPNGTYTAKTYNTSTGVWSDPQTVSVTTGSLTFSVGSLTANQDKACWVAPQ